MRVGLCDAEAMVRRMPLSALTLPPLARARGFSARPSVMTRRKAMRTLVVILLLVLIAPAALAASDSASGDALYRERCASCHEGGAARAPDVASLKQMSATAIRSALTAGNMRTVGESLNAAEIEAVSRFLGRAE